MWWCECLSPAQQRWRKEWISISIWVGQVVVREVAKLVGRIKRARDGFVDFLPQKHVLYSSSCHAPRKREKELKCVCIFFFFFFFNQTAEREREPSLNAWFYQAVMAGEE
ncbi:unnamed protein product [Camellia sinensis]